MKGSTGTSPDGADWRTVPIVAVDLEGSGAGDREDEAVLEIAVVPVTGGQPDLAGAWTTLVNPGRPVPRRPWISPGLTGLALASAPAPADIEGELARRLNGYVIAGHNVGVDWRLLHRRWPAIAPAGLIDTLRLARHLKLGRKNSLTALTDQLGLTPQVGRLAAGSQPHRALWDTVATALLLPSLIARGWPGRASLAEIAEVAGLDLPGGPCPAGKSVDPTLF